MLQHGYDFRPAELVRNLFPPGKHLAQARARDLQPLLRSVRACSRGRHAIAFIAEKGDVDLERLDGEAAGRKRVEDVLGVKRAVIAADAGVIAADDQIRAAKVLPDERMQQRLARAAIAHFDGVAGLDIRTGHKIGLRGSIAGFDTYLRRTAP